MSEVSEVSPDFFFEMKRWAVMLMARYSITMRTVMSIIRRRRRVKHRLNITMYTKTAGEIPGTTPPCSRQLFRFQILSLIFPYLMAFYKTDDKQQRCIEGFSASDVDFVKPATIEDEAERHEDKEGGEVERREVGE